MATLRGAWPNQWLERPGGTAGYWFRSLVGAGRSATR
jgi:hypothetical protein